MVTQRKGGAITGFLRTAFQAKHPKTYVILNPFTGTAYFRISEDQGQLLLLLSSRQLMETQSDNVYGHGGVEV